MRFGRRPAGATLTTTTWTEPLELNAPTNGLTNGFIVPARTGGQQLGFLAYPGEEILYMVEITPTASTDRASGPVIAPTLDDVLVVYMTSGCPRVLRERELSHD